VFDLQGPLKNDPHRNGPSFATSSIPSKPRSKPFLNGENGDSDSNEEAECELDAGAFMNGYSPYKFNKYMSFFSMDQTAFSSSPGFDPVHPETKSRVTTLLDPPVPPLWLPSKPPPMTLVNQELPPLGLYVPLPSDSEDTQVSTAEIPEKLLHKIILRIKEHWTFNASWV